VSALAGLAEASRAFPGQAYQSPGHQDKFCLADAINEFEGGLMLLSHDLRLIQEVAQDIKIYEKQTITKRPGDILAYEEHLKSKLVDDEPQLTKRTCNV
jgi:ATP-binding cassette subfamily F protein 2